jgi:hypothetical protein
MRLRQALEMQEVPPVDRAALEADREELARLRDDAACGLPVGRIRGYLDALAGVLPSPDEHPAHQEAKPAPEAVLRALESTGTRLRPPDPVAFQAFGPRRASRPWSFRSQAHLPSWSTIGLIVLGGALVLATSAWRDDVVKAVGEAVVFALVGARAFGIVVDRDIRKGDSDTGGVDEDAVDEPGAVIGFLLLVVTCVAAAVVVHEAAALAGVEVSATGTALFALLVALSLALEYGVVSADRLSFK